RRRHPIFSRDWSSDVCSSDLALISAVVPLTPGLSCGIERRTDASPLGPDAAVPVVVTTPREGDVLAVAVLISGTAAQIGGAAARSEERRAGARGRVRGRCAGG